MNRFQVSSRTAVALAFAAMAAAPVQAALTLYSTAASFGTAVGASQSFTDSLNDLSRDFLPSPLNRANGPYRYTVTAPGGLYGVGTAADVWLSTDLAGDVLSVGNFGGGTRGFGGLFFGTDLDGNLLAGQSITVSATDSTGSTLSTTVIGATTNSFVGFVSNGALTGFSVSIANLDAFVTANNLVTAVPEPAPWALWLAGVAALGACVRRRGKKLSV